jgi:hypothetical protein
MEGGGKLQRIKLITKLLNPTANLRFKAGER